MSWYWHEVAFTLNIVKVVIFENYNSWSGPSRTESAPASRPDLAVLGGGGWRCRLLMPLWPVAPERLVRKYRARRASDLLDSRRELKRGALPIARDRVRETEFGGTDTKVRKKHVRYRERVRAFSTPTASVRDSIVFSIFATFFIVSLYFFEVSREPFAMAFLRDLHSRSFWNSSEFSEPIVSGTGNLHLEVGTAIFIFHLAAISISVYTETLEITIVKFTRTRGCSSAQLRWNRCMRSAVRNEVISTGCFSLACKGTWREEQTTLCAIMAYIQN